ncbi:MAG: cation:proton antiporter, partial [Myxococcales bacterium]|nr:cation:proton antiporter [Myxococcales bacterium]
VPAREALSTAFQGSTEMIDRFLPMVQDGSLFTHVGLARELDVFSRIGVIILLFLVGLESNLHEMMRVGATSLMVAIIGVIAPFALGYGVSILLMPHQSVYVHLFVGATLCATSVGITARVFKDLGKLQTKEAKIILGAAVIDDVLGLIILAVVQGIIIAAGNPEAAANGSLAVDVLKIILVSALFLGGALVIGVKATPFITGAVAKMRVPGMKLIYSLLFAFAMSWLADFVGLASIVGAFAAGLVLEDVHFKDFKGHQHHLEELIEPIANFLVPVFFVLMGLQVKLETFANVAILGLAGGITLAALLGKQVCGLVVRDKSVKKMAIGFGMIPRGEVGLIFAAIGKSLSINGEPVVDSGTFSAVVIMVILTTLATPPLLKMSLGRGAKAEPAESPH